MIDCLKVHGIVSYKPLEVFTVVFLEKSYTEQNIYQYIYVDFI